jgi:2-iminobutanoate/2-iminopropanoate deaminase
LRVYVTVGYKEIGSSSKEKKWPAKSLDKIVSATIVLAEEDDFAGMNEEWLKWFPSNPPARQGAKLPARIPGLKVSIAVIAEV